MSSPLDIHTPKHQFQHTIQENTNVVLLSSYGRGELLGTSFSHRNSHQNDQNYILDDELNEDDEEEEEIGPEAIAKNDAEREILQEEQELLLSNGIDVVHNYHTITPTGLGAEEETQREQDELIVNTWEESIDVIKPSILTEFKAISLNSFPLIITFFLQNSLSVASIISIGHLGSTELAGITLGSMTANVTSFSIISGVSTCLDTLCAQLYGGKKYHLISLYFQRCNVMLMMIIIPIIIVYFAWGFSFLRFITNDDLASHYLTQYLKIISLGLPGYCLFETGKRLLQCQGIFHASTYVLFICAPINALLNYVLVWNKTIGIGYNGAPLLVLITYWLMPLGLLLYTLFTKNPKNPKKCWKTYSMAKILTNWHTLIKLALPSLIMIELEFLAFEFMTIFASKLSIVDLLAQSCIASISLLSWQLIFAISVAASTRVANYLGAGLLSSSQACCFISYVFAVLVSMLNCLILFIFRSQISHLFTSDSAIARIVIDVMPTLALFQFVDSLNSVGAGCLRGQGLQKIGSIINLISYYIMGLPLSYYLTFNLKFGLKGLWLGTSFLLLINSVVEIYFVFYSDWEKLYEQLKSRNEEGVV